MSSTAGIAALIVLSFALRVYQLNAVPLRWDEGWSIGISSLSPGEISRITALDVHPPLYYLLLKVWLGLGSNETVTRFLSVAFGVLIVPLVFAVGRAWHGRRVGTLAAGCAAIAPLLVYYTQVTRMYSLSVAALLLATYGLLQYQNHAAAQVRQARYSLLCFVFGATLALYTMYYTGFILAALFVYALLTSPRLWRPLLAAFGAVGVLFLPWAVYVFTAFTGHVGPRTGFVFRPERMGDLLRASFDSLVFANNSGPVAVYFVLALVALGLVLAVARRRLSTRVLLPILAVFFTLVGAAVGAQAYMLAPRYLINASPFLALALGWALAEVLARSRAGFAVAVLLLIATILPTITGYVYAKTSEVVDPFDPSADWQFLHGRARPQDEVFFNVLSLAGTYERYRQPSDPAWSYALRWDPVIEPLDGAVARIDRAAESHPAVWFVLYKGTVAANADLKRWLDDTLYPAFGQWREDTLYLAYIRPHRAVHTVSPTAVFGQRIALEEATYTEPWDGAMTVDITWRAESAVKQDYRVFVHLYAPDGRLVAQHDGMPDSDRQPTSTWTAGELIRDRHGILIPTGAPSSLRVVVGLYDPQTGRRLMLADGSDHVELGIIQTR